MTNRSTTLLSAGVLVVAAIALGVVLMRPGGPSVATSPTPTSTASPTSAASPTATASPSPSVTATPTTAASPTGSTAGRYISASLGYTIEAPPPWRLAVCGTGSFTHGGVFFANDVFVRVGVRDETGSSTGTPYENVRVSVEGNPQRLTPRQWADQGRMVGQSLGERVEDVTYAGRPAARKLYGSSPLATYFVADGDRMFGVIPSPGPNPLDAPTQQAMVRIVESFRFATPAEVSAARAAAGTPRPARSLEATADALAAAFAAKNVDALASLMTPCISMGFEGSGGDAASRERYLDDLRSAFAAGLTVAVRPRPFEGDPASGNVNIGATWTDQRVSKERKLMLMRDQNDRWEMFGTLERI